MRSLVHRGLWLVVGKPTANCHSPPPPPPTFSKNRGRQPSSYARCGRNPWSLSAWIDEVFVALRGVWAFVFDRSLAVLDGFDKGRRRRWMMLLG